MENKKVSIVIPVYNVSKYLKRNIESILKQTYSNFEAIYVDDGSTDNSLKILKKYKLKDKRIKVIHTENCGVSHTRNVGIDAADGKYLTFVDGDDYVDNDYLEYLVSLVNNENKMKMAISLNHHINDDMDQPEEVTFSVDDGMNIMKNIYLNRIFMAVWNKIYDMKFIKDNNVKFAENIWYAEGMHFNVQCLSSIDKIAVGNKKVYHYIANPNSAMRKGFNIKNEMCAIQSLDLQREILSKKGFPKCKELEYHYMLVHYMICKGIYENNLIEKHNLELKNSIQEIKKRKFIPFHIDLKTKEKILWLCIGLFPNYMIKRELRKHK